MLELSAAVLLLGTIDHEFAVRLWKPMELRKHMHLAELMQVHQLAALLNDTDKERVIQILNYMNGEIANSILRHMEGTYAAELTRKAPRTGIILELDWLNCASGCFGHASGFFGPTTKRITY